MSRTASHIADAVRRLSAFPESSASDRALLSRFAGDADEAAFAELVARHGPLVRGVCRRLLYDGARAEDAFQATFLVLARKAGSGGWGIDVGPWLYAVAARIARKARCRQRATIAIDPSLLSAVPAAAEDPADALAWSEVRTALDEELARLPDSLRNPLILCYLQAHTRDEAARLLGISLAKVKRRLERGRSILQARLTRRDISLSAAGSSLLLPEALPAGTIAQTVQAAGVFARSGVATPAVSELLRHAAMSISPTRWLSLAGILLLCAGSAIAVFWPSKAPQPPARANAAPAAPPPATRTEFPTDPLPEGAIARFGSNRLQDFTIDRSATFSPDGKLLATSGSNTPICIWDAATGKLVDTHANRGSVFDLRWKPDGKLAALTFFGHNAFLMQEFTPGKAADPKNDEKLNNEARQREQRPTDPTKEDRLDRCFLSADGSWVVGMWNVAGKPERRIDVYPFTAMTTSTAAKAQKEFFVPNGYGAWLSLDNKFLIAHISKSQDQPNKFVAFDLTAKMGMDKPAWELVNPGDPNYMPIMCLSADGKHVVTMSSDDVIELWDAPAGKRLRELSKLPKYYLHGGGEWHGLDLTADGKRLALVRRLPSGEVGGRIIDLGTGKDLCTLTPEPMPRIGGVTRFSADGKQVARVAYGAVRIWDAETGNDACPLPGHRGSINSLVAIDAKTILTAGDDLTVRSWDPSTGKETWRAAFPQVTNVKFATANGVVVHESTYGQGGRSQLLDENTGRTRPLPGKLGEAKEDTPVAIAPNGKSLLTFDRKNAAFRAWSWPAGELQATIALVPPAKLLPPRCAAGYFTADGKQFVAVMLYDQAGEQIFKYQQEHAFVERWDLTARKLLNRFEAEPGTIPALISHRSGVYFISKDNQLLDALTGQPVVKLQLAEGLSTDLRTSQFVALAPDGRTLAVARDYGNIMLFEMCSGRFRRQIKHPGHYLSGIQFLSDGRLVTYGETALIWSVGLRPAEMALGQSELVAAWANLAEPNPTVAWPAMQQFAGAANDAVDLIRKHVRPAPKITEVALDKIFRDLDSMQFKEREAASQALDEFGPGAVASVKARLAKGVPEEVHTRALKFLEKHNRTGVSVEELRALRAVEVLEAIGTPDARRLLGELAKGGPTERLTRDAAEALGRLTP